VQPLGRMGLLRSMLDWPARRARDALGCIVPLPRAGRYGRRTWLGEARVLQLTKFITALSPLGDPGRGRSDARASTVPSVISLVLAHPFVRCNQRQLPPPARVQVLEVPLEVLNRMMVGPT